MQRQFQTKTFLKKRCWGFVIFLHITSHLHVICLYTLCIYKGYIIFWRNRWNWITVETRNFIFSRMWSTSKNFRTSFFWRELNELHIHRQNIACAVTWLLYGDGFVIETYVDMFNKVNFFPKTQGTCGHAIEWSSDHSKVKRKVSFEEWKEVQ